ncbi:hypothetical protein GRF59_14365 [Paenibacillus sp. HJL G12]|uniref:Uncharacterized protein n=1 Tax=Paenibacillus dendrobii TaxID=2691084 RepID=A0A7X3IJX2_9BACL|nr:hypothetical protein [Paenibacillus dendrobii]MWV44801.1 hypothetical protein [Paenibacillus dendrobii]
MKYRVIKDIPDGWEGTAQVGDILTLGRWEGDPTLYKGKNAICDADSKYALEHCELIKEAEAK